MRSFILFLLFSGTAFAGTRFQTLSKYYETGYRPTLEHYSGVAMWAGKCVSQSKPEQFFPGILEVHHMDDDILGTSVVMKATLSPGSQPDHALNRSEKEARMDFSLSEPDLALFSSPKQGDKDIEFYRFEDSTQREQKELYRLRVNRNSQGVVFIVMQVYRLNSYRAASTYCYLSKDLFGRLHFNGGSK